jgi:hypothetical protein
VADGEGMALIRTEQLLREGMDARQIGRKVAEARLVKIRHGVYDDAPADGGPEDDHLKLIAGTVGLLGAGAILSHASAGLLHGMPVPRSALDKVTITRMSAGGGHVHHQLHEYKAALRDLDIVEISGLLVTSATRTAVDLARTTGLAYGLAACDVALRRGHPLDELAEQVSLWPRRPGMAKGRRAAALADGRSESYGESLSRLLMWQLGVPSPELQWPCWVDGRQFRSDFAWPELGVLGEFDGKIKYDQLLSPGQSAAEVVMAEKRREQALQAQSWYVVRWGMAELQDPPRFKSLLDAAFRNASRLRA